ncbi:MAG: lytic transglycosylase domain-containing protein [Bacteroidales bacterium]|nr:lytic transglycosylase domain-containing protein [Bacteroidales bacterium]
MLSVLVLGVSTAYAQFDEKWFLLERKMVLNKDSVDMDFSDADTVDVDQLDSLVRTKLWGKDHLNTDVAELNIYNFPGDSVPVYPDSVLKARIEELNRYTPINLTFNDVVKRYIDLYSIKKRDLTSRLLGRAHLYFPMFESSLDKHNLPLELKYLAIVESALNPTAGSHAGAKGLWQFMYTTGKVYGLEVNSFIDDRFDPQRSTQAAASILATFTISMATGAWPLPHTTQGRKCEQGYPFCRRCEKLLGHMALFAPRNQRLRSCLYCRDLCDELCGRT